MRNDGTLRNLQVDEHLGHLKSRIRCINVLTFACMIHFAPEHFFSLKELRAFTYIAK